MPDIYGMFLQVIFSGKEKKTDSNNKSETIFCICWHLSLVYGYPVRRKFMTWIDALSVEKSDRIIYNKESKGIKKGGMEDNSKTKSRGCLFCSWY